MLIRKLYRSLQNIMRYLMGDPSTGAIYSKSPTNRDPRRIITKNIYDDFHCRADHLCSLHPPLINPWIENAGGIPYVINGHGKMSCNKGLGRKFFLRGMQPTIWIRL